MQAAASNEREVRLGRVIEQLRRRLDQLRGENEQLEEELRSADSKLTGASYLLALLWPKICNDLAFGQTILACQNISSGH
jgi:hypothetical protein